MIVVKTKLPLLIGAAAVTFFPFVFVVPEYAADESTLLHESVHYEQQKTWAIYGFGIGLLVWYALYLFCLPVKWNPFRRKWETEAYTAQGLPLDKIHGILQSKPYYLD